MDVSGSVGDPGSPSVAHARLSLLQGVGARLTAARTSRDVVDVVLDEMAEAVGAAAATLSMVADDDVTVRVAGARGFPRGMVARWTTFDVSAALPMAAAIRSGTPVLLADAAEVVAGFPEITEDLRASGLEALAALPLHADGRVIGAIGLRFDAPRTFDEEERRFLESLALQCAVALDRSRAYEEMADARAEAEAARARLAFLAEASTVLASSLDWEQTLARVAELAVPQLADWCVVHLEVDGRLEVAKVAHADVDRLPAVQLLQRHHRPTLADPVGVGAVVRSGEQVWLPVIDDAVLQSIATNGEHLSALRTLEPSSVVIVPVRSGTRVRGAISLVGMAGRQLSGEDVVLAEGLAARASQAIANAQLYRERAHVARTLQASLLPPRTPTIPGVEVASRFVSGGDGVDVGGDFYDVFPSGEPRSGSWHVVIGDVRGKGVEAAALTGVARSTIRSAAVNESSPAEMLRHLNEILLRADNDGVREDGDPRFCTMVVGTLTPLPTGLHVELAVAGHPLPFLLRADGATEQVGTAGTLLGVVAEPTISDRSVELGPGDGLVLYTDGITERHAGDRFFEEEGLAKLLGRCAGFTAATVAERIETAARAFVEDAPRDDQAILVVRVPARPASTTSASTDLPAHPLSARRARRFVLTALEAFGARDVDEVAELLTSELVTNAVVHAHSGVRISVEGVAGGVRVAVADSDPLVPSLRRPVQDAEHGRGLFLVDTMASRWGVEPAEAGKTVWFELRTGDQADG